MSLLFGSRTETRALGAGDVPWWSASGGTSMSQDRALSLVPVYGAVRLISETIATMPLHAYTRRADGVRTRIDLPTVFDSPPDGMGTIAWLKRMITSLKLRGNAYGLITSRGTNGWPTGLVWINPARVKVDTPKSGRPVYFVDGRRLDNQDDMVHIAEFVTPGKAEGLSPVQAFSRTLDSGMEARDAARQWRRNRAIPGLKIRNTGRTMTDAQSDAVAARAREKLRNGEPWVSGKDWDLEVITIPPADAAFLESIRATANDVAVIYGLPPEKLGGQAGGSLTYSTVELNESAFITSLLPTIEAIEEVLSRRLMPLPQYLKLFADSRIRVDTKTRAEIYKIYREIGKNSIDDIRALEDEEPLPDGAGKSYVPLALVTKGDTK